MRGGDRGFRAGKEKGGEGREQWREGEGERAGVGAGVERTCALERARALLVRVGAANSARAFLPAMPPNTVSGMVTRHQMTSMTAIVPAGSAAVDCHVVLGFGFWVLGEKMREGE